MADNLFYFQAFSGRIYATGNPQACFELGNGAAEMTLRIPIGTQCGTVQSGRGRYVNHVVIQANPVIMQVQKSRLNIIRKFPVTIKLMASTENALGGRFIRVFVHQSSRQMRGWNGWEVKRKT